MNFNEILREKRPNLSMGSLITYCSLLRSVARSLDAEPTMEFYMDHERILRALESRPINTRKTITTALYLLTDNPAYRDSFMEDVAEVQKDMERQEMNQKQRDAWMSFSDIRSIWEMSEMAWNSFIDRPSLSREDYQILQKFVILSLMTGVFIPPRRLLDYTEMKVRNVDTSRDNYIEFVGSPAVLVFNRYKTQAIYGQQRIPIPPPLEMILKRWVRINPTEWLLFDNSMSSKLSTSSLNQRLNRYFGNRISADMLRHIYISEVSMKAMPALEYLRDVAYKMGHSLNMAMLYKKQVALLED